MNPKKIVIEKKKMWYDVLFSYLKYSNWNEDGSPSDDDTYYMVGSVQAESIEQVEKWINDENFYIMLKRGGCKEIEKIFAMEDYVEDTIEVVELLSCVGHEERP